MGHPASNATYLKNALDSFMSEEIIFLIQGYILYSRLTFVNSQVQTIKACSWFCLSAISIMRPKV